MFFSFGKQIPGTKRRNCKCLVLEPSEMLAVSLLFSPFIPTLIYIKYICYCIYVIVYNILSHFLVIFGVLFVMYCFFDNFFCWFANITIWLLFSKTRKMPLYDFTLIFHPSSAPLRRDKLSSA